MEWLIQVICSITLAADPGQLTDRAFQQAAALVSPSVVRIDTVGGRDQLEPGLVTAGATTGLIVSEDGYLVSSAFHFVSKPSSILVTLADGRRLAAREISTDRQKMITLLKVDAERLPVPAVAPKDEFHVGQWALALGRTFEADVPSVSVGIVSALNRVWGKAIQTDAKVSPVNYGGPLVDIEGRVMGVLVPLSPYESGDTAGVEWYDSGIGFAVPMADVLAVLDRMKAGDDLLPGQLGVVFKGMDLVQGEPLIERVRFDSPAAKAGMKAGDRITGVAGQPIVRLAELKHVLGQKYGGDTIAFEITRDGQPQTLELTLAGELPPFKPAFLGFQPERDPEKPAVTLRAVWSESPVARAGMKPGDRILKLNGVEIDSLETLRSKLQDVRPADVATLTTQRGDQTREIPVTTESYPGKLPEELPAQVTFGKEARPESLAVGRQSETLPGHERGFWMYVPENYHPDQPHSLVIFLHPSLNPMEQGVLTAWRPECERRGIILLAPRVDGPAGWSPNDLEFLTDCVAHVRGKYTIAPDRVAVIGLGNAARIAAGWAFRQSELFRGLALIDAPPLGEVPENTPERKLQIYSLPRGRGADAIKWKQSITDLQTAGYPAVLGQSGEEPGQYPAAEANAELARWIDSLDHI